MFERYTEKARRVIFFARYEASQFGSPLIETEHLLLGLLREDSVLAQRFLRAGALESIRKEVEANTEAREKGPTSGDLPLSHEGKRVLAYSAEEADRLNHKHIGSEHLLLGLLREEKCFAAKMLKERGLSSEGIRSDLELNPHDTPWRDPVRLTSSSRVAAEPSYLIPIKSGRPLVGRERELGWILQVLGRRKHGNPVLVGEPGVGKQAIVSGLAERIEQCGVPTGLSDVKLVQFDLPPWAVMNRSEFENVRGALQQGAENGAILVVDELHSMRSASDSSSGCLQEILKFAVVSGRLQVISITTPTAYAHSVKDHGWLAGCFQAVHIAPANPEQALQMLLSIQSELEEFHTVTYLVEAVERCIAGATACLPGRHLPGGAVDVMDEAGALVKLEKANPPAEIIEIQKRLQFIGRRLQASILNHEFEKARFYSDEERKERAGLRALREKLKDAESNGIPRVTAADVDRVISNRTGLRIETVQKRIEDRQE